MRDMVPPSEVVLPSNWSPLACLLLLCELYHPGTAPGLLEAAAELATAAAAGRGEAPSSGVGGILFPAPHFFQGERRSDVFLVPLSITLSLQPLKITSNSSSSSLRMMTSGMWFCLRDPASPRPRSWNGPRP